MFYVYILHSDTSDIFYVGHTDDVERRLDEHNELSETGFTSKHRPWILAAALPVGESRTLAIKIEKHIKRQKSRTYIQQIVERNSISRLIERYGTLS
jgi:putative endonuclease